MQSFPTPAHNLSKDDSVVQTCQNSFARLGPLNLCIISRLLNCIVYMAHSANCNCIKKSPFSGTLHTKLNMFGQSGQLLSAFADYAVLVLQPACYCFTIQIRPCTNTTEPAIFLHRQKNLVIGLMQTSLKILHDSYNFLTEI
jgi:hypothetical protein